MTDNTVVFVWNILAGIDNDNGLVVMVETIDNQMVVGSSIVSIVKNNN